MAYGLGQAADGGFAVDTVEEARQQAIELFTIDGMVSPEEDPVRSVLVQRMTDKIIQLEMVGLDVWNAMNVFSVSGSDLDRITTNLGVFRKQGVPQVLDVQLTSINVGAGYTIPAGTIFVTTDGAYTYQTISTISITSDTPRSVSLEATDNGEHPVAAGDKLVSQTYIPQLSDVLVTQVSTVGAANETDESLRLRFLSRIMSYIGTIEYMLNKLDGIEYIRKVGENHNNTSTTDADGVPPYSTEFLVLPIAGLNEDQADAFEQSVAQTILSFMLPGLPTYGSTEKTLLDYAGRNRRVAFTVPNTVQVEVFFKIGPMEGGTFSDTNVTATTQSIMNYINNMNIGQDVSMTKLWGLVTPNAQFDIVDYGIRRVGDSQWTKGNLSIGSREAAEVLETNIQIGPQAGE